MSNFLKGYLRDYRFRFLLALMLAAATLFAGIGLMATSGYLISRAALRPMIVDLFVITAAVRFFGISRAVLRYFERVVAHDLTFRILFSIRTWFYKRVSESSMEWLMGRRPGDLLAKAVADIETIQNAYLRVIAPSIVAAIVSIATCMLLWFISPLIALSTAIFLAISGLFYPWVVKITSKGIGKKEVEVSVQLKTVLVDSLEGLADVLWLGKRKTSLDEIYGLQDKLHALQKKRAGLVGLNEGINNLISNLGMFGALILAIPLVLSGELHGPMLALVTLGVLSSFEAVQPLANAFQNTEKTAEASKRLFASSSWHTPHETHDIPIASKSFDIQLKNVQFSYKQEHILLSDISFTIPEGSKIAMVGPSGSGKSTLVNLLLRLWEAESGEITLGGLATTLYPVNSLRSRFAVVAQDSYIFSRSIRDNLRIAKPGASQDDLDHVLAKVGLENFTSDHPNHIDSKRAVRLSGGERQLLALARALLNEDARIWVLDEPSANLDRATERKILNGIWSNLGHRTLIMITHRLVDMDKMDQIIVLDKGKIVEKGTHQELLAASHFYAKMFEQQNMLLK